MKLTQGETKRIFKFILSILKIKNNIKSNYLRKDLGNMATSSFTRKIVVTGKEAVDTIIDALVSYTPKKDLEEICRRN